MTDPNAISPTPETSGGEDGKPRDSTLKALYWWVISDPRELPPDVCDAMEQLYGQEWDFKAASRLSPPSSSGEEGERLRAILREAATYMDDRAMDGLDDPSTLASYAEMAAAIRWAAGKGLIVPGAVRAAFDALDGARVELGKAVGAALTSRHPHSGETK